MIEKQILCWTQNLNETNNRSLPFHDLYMHVKLVEWLLFSWVSKVELKYVCTHVYKNTYEINNVCVSYSKKSVLLQNSYIMCIIYWTSGLLNCHRPIECTVPECVSFLVMFILNKTYWKEKTTETNKHSLTGKIVIKPVNLLVLKSGRDEINELV